MSTICLRCPHCDFSREVPEEKVPDRPVRVTCPRCKLDFEFARTSSAAPPQEGGGAASSAPPASAPQATAPQATAPQATAPQGTFSHPPLKPAPTRPAAVNPKRVPPPTALGLPEIGALFDAAWNVFRRRWLVLVGLFVLAVVGAILPALLVGGSLALLSKNGVSFDGVAALLLIALAVLGGCIAFFRGLAGLMEAVIDEEIGFREALALGKSSWVALLWVSSLYGFIVGGASLLLIIPGIVISVWFFAAPYLAIAGETRGMGALLRSRALVKGQFWPILLRLFLVWLVTGAMTAIPFVGPFLAFATAPFTMLCHVILYRNLEDLAGDVAYPSGAGHKAGWLALGAVGYLLLPIIIISTVGVTFYKDLLPLLKEGSFPIKGGQVITIPPPSGELPAVGQQEAPGQAAEPPSGTESTTSTEVGQGGGSAPSGKLLNSTDLSVFIYAVNAPGVIRVNGKEFKTIEAKPDMQYNINTFGEHFQFGGNHIEFDVVPTPGEGRSLPPSIHMKITHNGSIVADWQLSDAEGWPRSATVDIAQGDGSAKDGR